MAIDAPLVAAATLHRQVLSDIQPGPDDIVYQLQLAHVLLDGGYDGVLTIGEALQGGDHGLGTLDRLDGELVIVDGIPWQVDFHGVARVVPPEAPTPFVVVSRMESPATRRVTDLDRDGLIAVVEEMVDDPGAVVSVRVEGRFHDVLVRSVPPQDPPYRPYLEVCQADEVRWQHAPFEGVFVGFRFPDLSGGDVIPGLHLHGLSADRSTGGHNHDLHVADALLSVGVSRDVVLALPDRGMVDLLETPHALRMVQRVLLRRGPRTAAEVASALQITPEEARSRLQWLSDRGFAEEMDTGVGGLGGAPRWRMRLGPRSSRSGDRVSELLADL